MNRSVVVYVLCGRERDGWINPAILSRVLECTYDGMKAHRPVAVALKCGVSPAERARNQIVQEFLANSQSSWLVMLDNDCIPPAHFLNLVDAAELDRKLIFGIPAPMITDAGLTWNIVITGEQCVPAKALPSGWGRCHYMGAAFLAIQRSVLETMKSDWFTRTPTTTTEDFAFCERARNAGFEPWFHGGYQCDHIHSVSLLELLNKQ